METAESFWAAVASVRAEAASAAAAGGRAAARAEKAMRAARTAAAQARAEAERLRSGPGWTRAGAGRLLWRAGAGRVWLFAHAGRAAALDGRAAAAERQAGDDLVRWKRATAQRGAFAAARDRLAAAQRSCAGARSVPEAARDAVAAALAACGGGVPRRGRALLEAASALAAAAARWTEEEGRERRRREALPAPAGRVGGPMRVQEDVYLPIPKAAVPFVREAGARCDPAGGRGSRWFVPAGTDLAPFERFLPLAYRSRPPALSFPPVPWRASGQNLWSVFDRDTWDQVRTVNYERTGHRCVLCGRRSGSLAKAIGGQDARPGTIDCHEVWEWKVPDPAVSVGVQRLRGLLCLCFECHATFHAGHAAALGRKAGLEDRVARFLMKRRAFLVRSHPVDVATRMKEESERLKAMSGTGLWIIDLSALAAQDYMRQVRPVLAEDNPAGVRPGQVAGLAFETDGGDFYRATSVRDVYAAVADLYRKDPLAQPGSGLRFG